MRIYAVGELYSKTTKWAAAAIFADMESMSYIQNIRLQIWLLPFRCGNKNYKKIMTLIYN